jgi:hypothetical protein
LRAQDKDFPEECQFYREMDLSGISPASNPEALRKSSRVFSKIFVALESSFATLRGLRSCPPSKSMEWTDEGSTLESRFIP